MSIPPRTSSAPSPAAPKVQFHNPQNMHNFHGHGLPQAPPTGLPSSTTPPLRGPNVSTPPPAPVTPTPEAPPTPPPQQAAPPVEVLDEHPPDLIYDVKVLLKYVNCIGDLPAAVHAFGVEQWGLMSDLTDRPDHMSAGRVGFFGDHVASMPNRLIQHRKLSNEVLGILSRVGPQNYSAMRDELLLLPIRQSDKEDIAEVIDSFFRKAIRPEDAPYTEYYVWLIRDLVDHMGRGDLVGIEIRKNILRKCQEVFVSTKKTELSDFDGARDAEEIEIMHKQVRDKGKSNIKLLGLLFNNGLLNENIPRSVLYGLLYGDNTESNDRHRHTPTDLDLDLFVDLLSMIGKRVSEKTSAYFPKYYESLKLLSATHPSKRIQFKLMDFLDLMKRGFDTATVSTIINYDAKMEERQAREAVAATEIPFQKFRDIMDYVVRDVADTQHDVELKRIPSPLKIKHIQDWLFSRISTVGRKEERLGSGVLFKRLVDEKVFTPMEVSIAIDKLLPQLTRGFVEDNPRVFESWAEVVLNGENVFTMQLHSRLLKLLADDPLTPSRDVLRMIEGVAMKTPTLHQQCGSRFRVLPALLRLPPYTDEEEVEDEKAILDPLDQNDSLKSFPEIVFYSALCRNEQVTNLQARILKLQRQDSNNLANVSAITCAIFCFVRFDIPLMNTLKLKDVMGKLRDRVNISTVQAVEDTMICEIYGTWIELDRCPQSSFKDFVNQLRIWGVLSPRCIGAMKEQIGEDGVLL